MKLQSRAQRHGETLLEFAVSRVTHDIAAKAFPDWTNAQREELVCNLFIQTVVFPTVQVE